MLAWPPGGGSASDEVAELLQRAAEAHRRELQSANEQLARARAELELERSKKDPLGGCAADDGVPATQSWERNDWQADPDDRTDTKPTSAASSPPSAIDSQQCAAVCRGGCAVEGQGSPDVPDENESNRSGSIATTARFGSLATLEGRGSSLEKPAFEFRGAWDVSPPQGLGPDEELPVGEYHRRRKRRAHMKGKLMLRGSEFGVGRCLIRPDRTGRLCWDIAGLVLIFYDFVAIPFVFSFGVDAGTVPFLGIMDWVTLLFWTADMCQAFFLAYFEDGKLVTSHFQILKNYVTGWWLIDALVVGSGWVMKFGDASGGQQVGFLAKIMKSARAIRILRLVRLVKLQRILHSFYDRIEDERKFIMVQLVRLLFAVAVMNHLIACFWFFLGTTAEEDGAASWTQTYLSHREHSLLDKYLTSLHWSMTQFTPASMSVSATNEVERAFSIIVLFFAMVCFSSIVASITGSMTTLRTLHSDTNREFWLLRRYLRQRSITQDLKSRVCKFLEFQVMGKPKRVESSQLSILGKLSEDLSYELRHADLWPAVSGHPIFQLLSGDESAMTQRLTCLCIHPRVWAESEVVFRAGDEAELMYFFRECEQRGIEDSPLDFRHGCGDEAEHVAEGTWISEAALWTEWRHRGELRCNHICDLIAVDPSKFVAAVRHHPRPWFLARGYGLLFLDWLNSLMPGELSDLLYDDFFCEHVKEVVQAGSIDGMDPDSLSEFARTFEYTGWYRSHGIVSSKTSMGSLRRSKTAERLGLRRFHTVGVEPGEFSSV